MKSLALLFCTTLLCAHVTQAGILAASTRVIYPQNTKQQTLILANSNDYPIVAQTWVDDGTGNPELAKAPFVVLPAVFKINPKGIQTIRMVHNGDAMPQDRESVFWLNLYEVAGKTTAQNQALANSQARLDFAMNTQLKIFYRPSTLPKMNIEQIAKSLRFSLQQLEDKWFVHCHNPTPYNVSLTGLKVVQGQHSILSVAQMDMMVPALADHDYPLETAANSTQFEFIEFSLLDDQGQLHNARFDAKSNSIQLQ